MRALSKAILSTALLLVCAMNLSFIDQTTDHSLARVSVYNGKQAFMWNDPTTLYDVAFTFNNTISDYDCMNPSEIAQASVANANQEGGNQNKLYDAIIIGTGDRDMAIVWKDKSIDNSIARVKKSEGFYEFVDCEPQSEYTIVAKYNISDKKGKKCSTQQAKIDKLIKMGTKHKKGKFDGVMYGNSSLDMVIKFNDNN